MQNNLERKLVDSAVGGDIESFGELCRQYYAAMAAIAYAVLGEHQLAEDAAQESFARALVNLRSLKNKDRFAPWLAGICRNVAKDMLAAKVRQIGSEDISQVGEVENHEENDYAIRRAIEQLPESAKNLVVLRNYDGF